MLANAITFQLVRNNGDKFPWNYVLSCNKSAIELEDIRKNGGELELIATSDNYFQGSEAEKSKSFKITVIGVESDGDRKT